MTYCTTGCGRPALRHGYCNAHLIRFYRHGSPGPVQIRGKATPSQVCTLCRRKAAEGHAVCYQHGAPPPSVGCSYPRCVHPQRSRGYCSSHYARLYQSKQIAKLPPRVRGTCSVENCGMPHVALGYCRKHYERSRYVPKQRNQKAICSIPDCRDAVHARGWCINHYQQWRAAKKPEQGWKPSKLIEREQEAEMDRRASEWLRSRAAAGNDPWARSGSMWDGT